MSYLFSFEKKRLRIFLCVVLSILFVLGVLSKEYVGPHRHWFKNYFGDMIFVMFFYFFIKFIRPYMHALSLGLVTFATVSLIEFSQKIHLSWLDEFRATFLGQLVLGQHYDNTDFIYYAVGTVLAMVIYALAYTVLKNRRPKQNLTHGEQLTLDFK